MYEAGGRGCCKACFSACCPREGSAPLTLLFPGKFMLHLQHHLHTNTKTLSWRLKMKTYAVLFLNSGFLLA